MPLFLKPMKLRRTAALLLLPILLFSAGCGRTAKDGEAGEKNPLKTTESTQSALESGLAASETATGTAQGSSVTESPDTGASLVASTSAENPDAGLKPVPPSAEALSVFPGVLRTLTMQREEIFALLGEEHETYDNVSQAYSVYSWNALNLVLEYDSLSGKLRMIRTGERTLFLDGASYREADLNRDGILEGICAYEDLRDPAVSGGTGADPTSRREGHVVIVDEATGSSLGESITRPFDGYAGLSFLTAYGTDKECLILLDTQSDWECDVLSYANRQLVSMLPAEALHMAEQAKVMLKAGTPDRIQLSVESAGLSFACAMPERLQEALDAGEAFKYQFVVNRKPIVTDDGLTLRLRNSLQVLLGTATDLEGNPIGRFIDIGQVTQEYRYMGRGVWKLLKTGGGPKYTEAEQGGNVTVDDLTVGPAMLFAVLYDYTDAFGLDPATYKDVDLVGGITFQSQDKLRISVINSRISNIVLEEGCTQKTVRGLSVGDTRGDALEKYGQPDAGYFEDRIWTYWFYRDLGDGGERVLSLDSFTLEFDGDKVVRIGMNAYIPID